MLPNISFRCSRFACLPWPFCHKSVRNRLVHKYFAKACRTLTNMTSITSLNFDNRSLRDLPLDPEKENFVRQVPGAIFSTVPLTPVANPETVGYSVPALSLLDLGEEELKRSDFAEYFSGSKLIPGSEPAAHCYCGHQFGYFSGQLGDGAAMYLGEVVNKAGERWEIQFKGAGKTPYSRTADGRKVLRSSVREFLCSEAMYHLGVPTTRAGSCVTSDTRVERDLHYTGNTALERSTVVLRIAPTFIRFGSFEIVKPLDRDTGRAGPSANRKDVLEKLLNYTIQNFFPEAYAAHSGDLIQQTLAFYREVIQLTAKVAAEWQAVGFCHGVLNTDNMSILGLTIDYGPFGFMDAYDENHICNESDGNGRYSFKKQPEMCLWNLGKLGEAISLVLPLDMSRPELETFYPAYKAHYMKKMRMKMGLFKVEDEDSTLIGSFVETMKETYADFTNCFRSLCNISLPGVEGFEASVKMAHDQLLDQSSSAEEYKKFCKPKMHPREIQLMVMLMQTNPQVAYAMFGNAHKEELERMAKYEDIRNLTEEEKKRSDKEKWSAWLQKYTSRLRKEVEGEDEAELCNKRTKLMKSNNPRFILRNYIAQNAIEAAENGDFSEVRRVLKLLENPFSDFVDLSDVTKPKVDSEAVADEGSTSSAAAVLLSLKGIAYDSRPPDWSADLRIS